MATHPMRAETQSQIPTYKIDIAKKDIEVVGKAPVAFNAQDIAVKVSTSETVIFVMRGTTYYPGEDKEYTTVEFVTNEQLDESMKLLAVAVRTSLLENDQLRRVGTFVETSTFEIDVISELAKNPRLEPIDRNVQVRREKLTESEQE